MKVIRMISVNLTKFSALTCFIFVLTSNPATAQTPNFRQQYTQRNLTNPALAGLGLYDEYNAMRLSSGSRAQWLGLSSRLLTQNLGFDNGIKNTRAAYSLNTFVTDMYSGTGNAAKYSHYSAMAGYAYEIPFKKFNLRLGLSLQFSSFKFGTAQFLWDDQINAENTGFINPTKEPLATQIKQVFHVAAGAFAYSKRGYIGISAFNINQPEIAFTEGYSQKLDRKISAMAGYSFPEFFAQTTFLPNASYSLQNDIHNIQVNTNFRQGNIQYGIGLQYLKGKNNTSAMALCSYFGVRYDKYYLGYSTDWNLSMNYSSIPITHEIGLVILIKKKTVANFSNIIPEQ